MEYEGAQARCGTPVEQDVLGPAVYLGLSLRGEVSSLGGNRAGGSLPSLEERPLGNALRRRVEKQSPHP